MPRVWSGAATSSGATKEAGTDPYPAMLPGDRVQKRTTATTVTCTPAPVPEGGSTTCTATVLDVATGPASTPSGAVRWSSSDGAFGAAPGSLFGSGPPPRCILNDTGTVGVASCAVSYTPGAGPHTVTASYDSGAETR